MVIMLFLFPLSLTSLLYIPCISRPHNWVREMWSIGSAAGLNLNMRKGLFELIFGASQSEWQKGEAEPRKQKQGAMAQVLGDATALQDWSTGKVPCSWQERDKVATKLHFWTWCESGSQAWAGAMATWLGWGITVSGLASLCVRESLILARLSVKVCPNLGQFDAFVSGELNAAVLHLKLCVMTIEPNEFPKKLQEEFSEISGRHHAPTL